MSFVTLEISRFVVLFMTIVLFIMMSRVVPRMSISIKMFFISTGTIIKSLFVMTVSMSTLFMWSVFPIMCK